MPSLKLRLLNITEKIKYFLQNWQFKQNYKSEIVYILNLLHRIKY
jgi:hypothetical protein